MELSVAKFEELNPMIWYLADRFTRQAGWLEREELHAVGCLEAVVASVDYIENDDVQFSSYLYQRIWYRYLSLQRMDARRRTKHREYQKRARLVYEPFKRIDLLDSLSCDAQTIVELCFNMPTDLLEAIQNDEENRSESVKWFIREYLIGLGWQVRDITRAFNEIRRAL